MKTNKVIECILFFQCRAGLYPFGYETPLPLIIFFEKLMRQNKLNLDIPKGGNDLIDYIMNELIYMQDSGLIIFGESEYIIPFRDIDLNILGTEEELLALHSVLADMIGESHQMARNRRIQ